MSYTDQPPAGSDADSGNRKGGGLAGLAGATLVGGALGLATIVGIVNSQTGAPSESPANVNQPFIDYGE